jgi:CelD/BcsL family acetyltransferase involved in cellulose biosynthesis
VVVEVERLTQAQEALYEQFIEGRPEALLYHSLRYRELLQVMLGSRADYLAAWRGNRLVGILPLMHADGPFGQVINSLPFFGSHGGVIAEDSEATEALWAAFRDRASRSEVCAASVIGNPFDSQPDLLGSAGANLSDRRISQSTPLEGGDCFAEKLLDEIDGSARRNLRKAEVAGVRITIRNDAVSFLADAHWAQMREIGGFPKPAAFFAAFPEILRGGEDYRLYVAELDGTPVAALLMFYFKRFAEYIMPVTAPGLRELQPSAALLFRAMSEAAAEGRRVWNWGGTWLNQTGVYRFKRKWGAQERIYEYAVVVNDPTLLDRSADELATAYPYFYVVPYSALRPSGRAAEVAQ